MLVCGLCILALSDSPTNLSCRVFDPPEDNPVQRFSRSFLPQGKRVKDQTFAFDRVFDDNTQQADVYEATTRPLLDSVLEGYNATVFAYGATGCGKTHTITGTVAQPGIIFMTMQELFEKLEEIKETKETEVTLSYLEIYNETIRDLLVEPHSGPKQGLMLREDSQQAVSVAGLSSHKPQNVAEVMDMVIRGNSARTQSPTEANATSSRSHAVLQVNVSLKDRNADVHEPVTFATLSIIDLAGSERASVTKNRGERLLEGANINKSLLALGSCINALCDPRRNSHVPYRNSKLTRLLKFSLGGNCRTVMIVCVSPSSAHFDETQNTLRYANRAKNIQTKSIRNVYNVDRHVKDYVKKIDEQRNLIQELQTQMKDMEKVAMAKLQKSGGKLEQIMRDGIERIRQGYEHSTSERRDRISTMVRLRATERRISAISMWIGAFDQVTENREEEEPPTALVEMRKQALGIMAELENTRQHHHQRLHKNNWTRAIDTALQDGTRQLQSADGFKAGCPEEASLNKEVELLKNRADLELNMTVLEQDKGGEAGLMQVMLTTQFETIAIINQLMYMSEEEAVQSGREVMGKLLQACTDATSQVIKPDGGLQITTAVAPSRSGTPRKKKALMGPSPIKSKVRQSVSGRTSLLSQPVPSAIPAHIAAEMQPPSSSPRVGPSPSSRGANASPKRRVKLGGISRKAFSGNGTPKRKSPSKKRAVRWRDESAEDGTEPGSLVEYQPTPRMPAGTPPFLDDSENSSTKIDPPNFSVEFDADGEFDSSPVPAIPVPRSETASEIRKSGTGRFAIGSLSKTKSDNVNGSPLMPPPPSLTLGSFSSEDESSPLREIGANRAPHTSLRSLTNQAAALNISGDGNTSSSDDVPASENDSSYLVVDKETAQQLGTAMSRRKRSSSLGGPSANRLRAERRRSPPSASASATSPPNTIEPFSASHARRMVVSNRDESSRNSILSPAPSSVEKIRFSRPSGQGVRQRQSMIDIGAAAAAAARVGGGVEGTPNGYGGSLTSGMRSAHFRASSVIPGSAGGKRPWR